MLTDAPGVSLRLSMLGLPGGSRFELTEFTGLERRPAQARYMDPGAASLVVYAEDIDSLLSAAKRADATVVTTGGAPVEIPTAGRKTRSVMLRDPDGFFVQLVEEPPATATGANAHRISLAYTMQDAAATRRFYTGMMALALDGVEEFVRDPAYARLIGAPEDVEFRRLTGTMPPGATVVFTEFRRVPRTKFHLRVRDPGAPALAVEVDNLEGMVVQMKAAGVDVISTGGELVDFGNGVRNIFVVDPNGMNLELIERPPRP